MLRRELLKRSVQTLGLALLTPTALFAGQAHARQCRGAHSNTLARVHIDHPWRPSSPLATSINALAGELRDGAPEATPDDDSVIALDVGHIDDLTSDDPVLGLFAGLPGGLDYLRFDAWLSSSDGRAALDAAAARSGRRIMPLATLKTSRPLWSRAPMTDADTWSGRKLELTGNLARIAEQAFDVEPMRLVALPEREVCAALKTGRIDAAFGTELAADCSEGWSAAASHVLVDGFGPKYTRIFAAMSHDDWHRLTSHERHTLNLAIARAGARIEATAELHSAMAQRIVPARDNVTTTTLGHEARDRLRHAACDQFRMIVAQADVPTVLRQAVHEMVAAT